MKRMMFYLAVLPFVMVAAACGPLSFTMDVELRDTSRSGLDLARKTFSVVYVDNGTRADSVFAASAAEGFAQKLEAGYFSGERVIGVYTLDSIPGADYSAKDTLLNILMDVGTDVVFLIEPPIFGNAVPGQPEKVETGGRISRDSTYLVEVSVPFSVGINVYDSMNPADSVFTFFGRSTARPVAYTDGKESSDAVVSKALESIGEPAKVIGAALADSFVSTWKNESHNVIYYNGDAWLEAALMADDYRWKDAVEIWMELVDTGNLQKRSCAEYNIALGCYMLGEYDLALEWLDRSDADYPVYQSRGLRQKIEARNGSK